MTQATLSLDAFLRFKEGPEIETRTRRTQSTPRKAAQGGIAKRGRRGLVLTDERARHPFRASLPPHVRDELPETTQESLWRITSDDVRGVAGTYFAVLAAVFVFII